MSTRGKSEMVSMPDDANERIPGAARGFMLVVLAELRPLLRPSARKDLSRHVRGIDSVEAAQDFLSWARLVIAAHREAPQAGQRGRAATLVAQAKPGMFRRPDRAYRVRWLP